MEHVEEGVEDFLLEGEEVTYSFTHRPTGLVNWVKSLLGFGESHWYLTDERLIVYRRVAGGFGFREVPLENVTSVEYGRQFNIPLLVLGILTIPLLIGILIVIYAVFRKEQALQVHVSGGENLALTISKGSEIDEFLWYLPARRKIKAENA